MTTLAVSSITAFARGGVQALTQLAVSTATSAISRALDNRVFEGPRLESFQLQTSRDGAPMPRVFGRVRLAGQVIWSSAVREDVEEESVGGKGGGPVQRNYSYTVSFAVGLCEGEILNVDRIWANGELLNRSDLTIRIHRGREDQGPDPVIAATELVDVPAFRGTAYLVFEDFPLDAYGGRLPSINAEIVRRTGASGNLESRVRAVNLLPGTGEYALDPSVVGEQPGLGVTRTVNFNNFTGHADMIASLDQLEAELPNCRHVNLISAWFGTSLDAGECRVRPGVERIDRRLSHRTWSVDGIERADAHVISADENGRANYGGTPSDDTIVNCIRELKSRGFRVTLYPFLLMDIPGFPWRGRITASKEGDVASFFGFGEREKFVHCILHHATLANDAGGVDSIVIGSELKGLMASVVNGSYQAVEAMKSLARDVRSRVGPDTKITYAADWSDYFGIQDGGDVTYHLDTLWALPEIDAVGIDCYFPLADWRDGDEHLDAAPGRRGHEIDYLRDNVEGGEGYDWYYASPEDRDAQVRTPIDDPVYRYKDLRHWWSQPHVNRVGGVPTEKTAWVPGSKPIWLMEVGCPAVDKGANQPNVFYDAKSIDSARPYYSSGARDDLIQRRYLEALLGHYEDTEEPGFIDNSRSAVWAWDLRPYPSFPSRLDVWADGASWARGHWLNGRTGLTLVSEIIEELALESGLTDIDVSGVSGVIAGYVVDRPMSARAALAPLLQLYAVEMNERDGDVVFRIGGGDPVVLDGDDFIAGPVRRTRADSEARIRDVRVTYLDPARDYQLATASARNLDAESVAIADMSAPAVLDEGFARHVARRELDAAHAGEATLRLSLPLSSGLALQTGDRFVHDDALWVAETVETGRKVDITAKRDVREATDWVSGAQVEELAPLIVPGPPQLLAFDLPGRAGISVGALLEPFSPVIARGPNGREVTLTQPLRTGATLSALPRRNPALFDRTTQLDVLMPNLPLSSQVAPTLQFAVETPTGWEVIAAQLAELIAPATYRLSGLVRGLDGSDAFMANVAPGARIVWLGAGLGTLPIGPDWRGEGVVVTGRSESRPAEPADVLWQDLAGLPFAPVHPRYHDGVLCWSGRDAGYTDWSADDAGSVYKLRLTRGSETEVLTVAGDSAAVAPFDRVEIFGLSAQGRESAYPATL